MKVIAVIQARMSSSRLPGKVLRPILGRPMLAYQLERVSQAERIDKVIVATSTDESDDPIEHFCQQAQVACYRGSLNDVLGRYVGAAGPEQPDHVVRLTGDCPLSDPAIIDAVVDLHCSTGVDYTTNSAIPTLPDGFDVEVVRFDALQEAHMKAELPSEREHVTPYIRNRPAYFEQIDYLHPIEWANYRLTVDYPEDFVLVQRVFKELYPVNSTFTVADVMQLLNRYPQWLRLNEHFERNEGLKKSEAEDAAHLNRLKRSA